LLQGKINTLELLINMADLIIDHYNKGWSQWLINQHC